MEDPRPEMKAKLKQAMRDKDVLARDAIRMTLSAIKQVEVDTQSDVESAEATKIVIKEVKKREEAVAELIRVGRSEDAEEEVQAIGVLQQFLPEQISDEELARIVSETISEVNATSMADMGQVMSAAMPKVGNQADGKAVSAEVRRQLQG